MSKSKITLSEAVKFHGHLGPYLVLGILAGEFGLKIVKAKKYFGLNIDVFGASKKPKSCLIDGLQLSTGATFGKGNIHTFNGPQINIIISGKNSRKKVSLKLKKEILDRLEETKTHKDADNLAKKLYRAPAVKLFNREQVGDLL
jgi:formylmethanofuran dehydrogenase subunit E